MRRIFNYKILLWTTAWLLLAGCRSYPAVHQPKAPCPTTLLGNSMLPWIHTPAQGILHPAAWSEIHPRTLVSRGNFPGYAGSVGHWALWPVNSRGDRIPDNSDPDYIAGWVTGGTNNPCVDPGWMVREDFRGIITVTSKQ